MTDTLRQLRKRIAQTRVNRRGYKQYGPDLRQAVIRYAANRTRAGESYNEIAATLELPSRTLVHWCEVASREKRTDQAVEFRPVSVQTVDDPADTETGQPCVSKTPACPVVVVLPSGVRLEGFTADAVAEFVRRLGWL